ncbi:hypothetical protein [Streptomyces antimicrobicus]|uniref:Lipoprotein n=1 Tax=Streptomyces antimicrobicus TaxID=2883108 RepID=A0ABS8B718_9ACTN|nr:hypothetical protein [Streptomyces antimicrobicus]MCB5180390.1 hypothetical protein [Streptomyces antimicrobicus]
MADPDTSSIMAVVVISTVGPTTACADRYDGRLPELNNITRVNVPLP